jgi:Ca2+-binding RTX toxin-like protein
MFRSLARWLRRSPHSTCRRRSRCRLRLEGLEGRDVPAVAIQGSDLVITGTAGNDNAEVSFVSSNVIMSALRVELNGQVSAFNARALWGVNRIVFHGGNGNDRVDNLTGMSLYAEGDDGDDTLVGGSGADQLYGGDDNDSLLGSDGDDALYGGGDGDTVKGGDGDDLLKGGSGHDRLEGNDNHDMIYGESGEDSLTGGSGNDALYGGTSADDLDGGSGDDGVFGGSNTDTVRGGTGDDRFLSWKHATGWFGIMYDPDTLEDVEGNDAKINFENGNDKTIILEGEDEVYEAKDWSNADIERLDAALAVLHREVGNTTLLKTSWGWEVTFERYGGTGRGFNSGGRITLTDAQFDRSDNYLRGYVLHEIGHNWDDENPNWDAFKLLSGWTSINPNNSTVFAKAEHYNWWYRKNADFARGYAKNSPYDDFAESFAAYFMDQAGWDGGTDPYFDADEGAAAIPEKISLIDDWVDSL